MHLRQPGRVQSGVSRTETAPTRGAWTRWCFSGYLSLRTLQRGNAVLDALRHT
ncbi:DUF1534 domain-containing protein [Pseudomonas congelans]|nr:DUF1534 domain-containing protein [Pseudomonas congelans]